MKDEMRRDRTMLILAALTLIGLGLRLLVWRWREFYPLGGDETEYFNQALTWLQGKGYVDLPLMRPPLYTVFLAVIFQLVDSQVQRVRLVQAIISAGTILLMWLWTRELFRDDSQRERIALVAAAITALCYTFAANATELLTETLFVAGLTLAFWLILRTARTHGRRWAIMAGCTVGALSLLRSVALPLVPLGLAWLLLNRSGAEGAERRQSSSAFAASWRFKVVAGWWFVLASLVVIAPWTIRNYVTYGAPILIDTTGAENLWLDNNAAQATPDDPLGRESAKRQLYALGDDRAARQRLATARGIAQITTHPGWFVRKMWGEAQKFVALEHFDDLRERRAIWVRPLDVWLRLTLGDAMWLLIAFGGVVGLWLYRHGGQGSAVWDQGAAETRRHGDTETRRFSSIVHGPSSMVRGPKWLLVPWALYVFLTGLIFHVELRYRLPLYPVLIPYAAAMVAGAWSIVRGRSSMVDRPWPVVGAIATAGAISALMLLHRPYLAEAAMLTQKHYHLWQADRAWRQGDMARSRLHAEAALSRDPRSALARVRLGLSADGEERAQWWRAAIDALPAHPYAHLLLGDWLRNAGEHDSARRELAYESASLEDLQRWSLATFAAPLTQRVEIGDGLDLGYITGFHESQDGARWTTQRAAIYRLAPGSSVALRLMAPRPAGAPPATVLVTANDQEIGRLTVGDDWQIYRLELPPGARESPLTVALMTSTFRPRAYDRADPDNRDLGVAVDWIQIVP